jgi:hypothetical protein
MSTSNTESLDLLRELQTAVKTKSTLARAIERNPISTRSSLISRHPMHFSVPHPEFPRCGRDANRLAWFPTNDGRHV